MEAKKPFYEKVAEKLIAKLKEGTAPWQKPWQAGDPGSILPVNPTTGKRYRGINAILLMSQNFFDQRWMTYKQASAVDAQVRKGETGTPVQYWKFTEEQTMRDANGAPVLDAEGEPVKETVKLERPRVFFATVFNADQIDGLPALQPGKEKDWNAQDRAERILQSSGAVIRHGGQDRAFYRPATDSIHMPDKALFPSADNYYATALHELGHWTGHESRLDRDLVHPFGSEEYAKEELRAEIASMILGDELGVGHDPGQHAAYVASWIKALEEDPLEIFRAAADAEKIQDYILDLERKQVLEQVPQENQVEAKNQVLAELLELHQSVAGDSALEAWENMETTAQAHGLTAVIGRGGGAKLDAPYVVAYLDQSGRKLPITSEIFKNGKASTMINGQHVPGNRLTSDFEWQSATLNNAVALVRDQTLPSDVADVACARLGLITGDTLALDRNRQAFDLQAKKALGFTLPHDWTGEVRIVGTIERDGQVLSAGETGERPEAFQLYARKGDAQPGEDAFVLFASRPTEPTALELADRLALIDAYSQTNEYDKAAKLARINEARVGRDPNSTEEDLLVTKELRKNAEFKAGENDKALQQRLAEAKGGEQQGASMTKIFLDVPFKQKEEAKALGARWDRQEQSWYVPPHTDAALFARWAKKTANAPEIAKPAVLSENRKDTPAERLYLAVPYGERLAAKAAGAMWDKTAKSWYAGPKADLPKLERWTADRQSGQQGPAMRPQEEFVEALSALGCQLDDKHPVMDGAKHRIAVAGDTKGEQSGFYVGHLDGHPAGYIKNNRTGIDMKWKSKGYVFDPEQKAQMQAEAAAKLQAREVEHGKLQERTAQHVGRQMLGLVPATQPTTYLQAKGLQPQIGVMTDKEGRKTYIPAIDADGKQWTMQYIQEDGTKRFAKDGRKEGCFHPVGGLDALAAAPALVIGEGYATAGSLSQTLGFATVAAFDSGNLVPVARNLHEKFPEKPVIIAGDDDKHLEITQGVNPGRSKAEEAAQAVGGKVLLPIFAPGEGIYPAGLVPITPQAYREHLSATKSLEDAVKEPERIRLSEQQTAELEGAQLSKEQLAAIEVMKQHTDFNDLATRSKLGVEGIQRQVNPIVDAMIEKSRVQTQKGLPLKETLSPLHVNANREPVSKQEKPQKEQQRKPKTEKAKAKQPRQAKPRSSKLG